MKNRIVIFVVFVCCLWTMPGIVRAQLSVHQFDQLMKKIDDVLWYEKVGDIAHVDKVILCGPPRWKESNPTSMSAGNELKFRAYIFIPKSVKENKKYPLIVFPHSGVHADMDTYYAHIIRELIAQEYIVVAADYRGSTGYGAGTYNNIDYGGLENEDVYISRNYMVDNFDIVDGSRVGIMGWSHGGMITLMNLFNYPGQYKCGFAGGFGCNHAYGICQRQLSQNLLGQESYRADCQGQYCGIQTALSCVACGEVERSVTYLY